MVQEIYICSLSLPLWLCGESCSVCDYNSVFSRCDYTAKNDHESTHFYKSKSGYYISMWLLIGRQTYPHHRHFYMGFPIKRLVLKPRYGYLNLGMLFKRGNIRLVHIWWKHNAYLNLRMKIIRELSKNLMFRHTF